jgi:hypothetical protein
MTLYVLALNREIQEIIPEGCSVIGCGFSTIPARQIGQAPFGLDALNFYFMNFASNHFDLERT